MKFLSVFVLLGAATPVAGTCVYPSYYANQGTTSTVYNLAAEWCAENYENSLPVWRDGRAQMCYNNFDDCKCPSGYHKVNHKCVVDPCMCPDGYLKIDFNFDHDVNGDDTIAGHFADDIDWPAGVLIKAVATTIDSTPARPMLFDSTANPLSGGDTDLAAEEGNILIISEDNDQNDPDDNAGGGDLIFEFPWPVYLCDVGYIDLEETSPRSELKVMSDETQVFKEFTPYMTDGLQARQYVGKPDVTWMQVWMAGSGGVTDLHICKKPGVYGDPHFTTWFGDNFDYHGICDLLFMESPNHNMTTHIRTTQKYHYSYVSSAAIQVNDDVYEFAGWGSLIVNGVTLIDYEDEDVPTTIGGYKLTVTESNKKDRDYLIEFGDGSGIAVKSHKDMVSVRPVGSQTDFIGSRGLMGDPLSGAKLGRNGVVIQDADEFGQEWQVREEEPKLFDTVRLPQAPHKCVIPTMDAYMHNYHLGNKRARKEAEVACAAWKMNKEACITDVLLTGDPSLAAAFM